MERGNAKHGPHTDDELAKDVDAQLRRGGAQPDPWAEPEPLDDLPDDEAVPSEVDGAVPNDADRETARDRLLHDETINRDLGPGDAFRE